MDVQAFGRSVVLLGLGIVVVGLFMWLGPRLPFFGRLPGDVAVETERVSFFAPLGSMLIISLVLTLVLNLFAYLRR
jgi:hypothetical protein